MLIQTREFSLNRFIVSKASRVYWGLTISNEFFCCFFSSLFYQQEALERKRAIILLKWRHLFACLDRNCIQVMDYLFIFSIVIVLTVEEKCRRDVKKNIN